MTPTTEDDIVIDSQGPVIEDVVTEPVIEDVVEPVVEPVVSEYVVAPSPLADNGFDYYDFRQNGRIDFSPEYFEEIMKLYGSRKKLRGNRGRGANTEATVAPNTYTPTQAFAIQAAAEFNARTGMGDYRSLRDGTSKFRPGVKLTDKQILKYITTMEEKGFLESLGTRLVENVPSATAFGAGFATGKKIQSIAPNIQGRLSFGAPVLDRMAQAGQTAYTAGRFAIPYITGIASSIFSADYGEPFGELFLGKKTLPTPDTYSTMRSGEVAADIAAFSPYTFFADRAASNMLTDYFTNRLANNSDMFGRGFNFSDTASTSFAKQWKNAQKVAAKRTNTRGDPRVFEGSAVPGPLNINDLNERGVAAVLQGKTAPGVLRMLLTIENSLKTAGKDARKNPGLTLFYETVAATGASLFVKGAAESSPFGSAETTAELLGGIALPMFAGQTVIGVGKKIAPYLKTFNQNRKDLGLVRGTAQTVRDVAQETRDERGFLMVVDVLERAGSLDDPKQLNELIASLEAAKTIDGNRQTAGQASKNPAIMAMEAALARDFDSLSAAQKAARQKEVEFLEGVLEQLAFAEGTEFSKEAFTIGAQIKEAIQERALNARLVSAEQNLLKAFQQVETSGKPVLGPDGQPLTAAERTALDNEGVMDLSERLFEMLKAQKGFARSQQETLYKKVGNLNVDEFFTDDGATSTVPKFIRLLIDQDDVIEESSVKKELSALYRFAQRQSDALNLNYDLALERPAAEKFSKALDKNTASFSLEMFELFRAKLAPQLDNSGIPEVVTDPMIRQVREARNQVSKRDSKDRYDLYDSFLNALIEKRKTQAPDATAQAQNAARDAEARDFDDQASVLFQGLNDGETQSFNNFMISIENLNPAEKAGAIRKFVAENSMRPDAHPGKILAEKMDFLASNPLVKVPDASQVDSAGISLSELRQIRTEALDIARDGQKSPTVRRAAGLFASAVEDDISNFSNFGGGDTSSAQIRALQDANAFTKAFADVFYRSYVGDALSQTKAGAYRIAPETMGANFTTSRFDPNFLKIRDIEEVGRFMRDQGIPGGEGALDSVNGVIDRIIRTARAESIDPETNAVSQKRLRQWLQKNQQLSELFPEVFADLNNFAVAKATFEATTSGVSAQKAALEKQINYTSVLRSKTGEVRTNPTSAIAEAMAAGKDQVPALARLIDIIPSKGTVEKAPLYEITDPATGIVTKFFDRKSARAALETIPGGKITQKNLSVTRDEALDGFKSSFFEYLVFGQAGGRGGSAIQDPLKLYRDLFEKRLVVGGKTSSRRGDKRRYDTLTGYLQKKGVFNEQEVAGLKKTLEALISAKTDDAAAMLGENFEEAKPILDFGLAIFGSAIGTKSQSLLTGGQGGPGSIIAAGKGAEAMRNIFLRMPQNQRMLFTAELLQKPELMAMMLRKYGDGDQKKGVVQTVVDWLKTNGFSVAPRRAFSTSVQGDREPTSEQFDPGTFKKLPSNDQQGAVAPAPVAVPAPRPPVQRPSPVATPTTRASAVPSPSPDPAPVNTGPVDRTRYAALFPNDMASGMIRQSQGIGSLI